MKKQLGLVALVIAGVGLIASACLITKPNYTEKENNIILNKNNLQPKRNNANVISVKNTKWTFYTQINLPATETIYQANFHLGTETGTEYLRIKLTATTIQVQDPGGNPYVTLYNANTTWTNNIYKNWFFTNATAADTENTNFINWLYDNATPKIGAYPYNTLQGTKWLMDQNLGTIPEIGLVENINVRVGDFKTYTYLTIGVNPLIPLTQWPPEWEPLQEIDGATDFYYGQWDGLTTIYRTNNWNNTNFRVWEFSYVSDTAATKITDWFILHATKVRSYNPPTPTEPESPNLTGTYWLLDNTIEVPNTTRERYDINFISNNATFSSLSYQLILTQTQINYDNNIVYGGTWQYDGTFRLIHITGGEDVENEDLIDWLNLHATRQQPSSTGELVDIPGAMYEVIGMPFTFIGTAFDVTLFPNTPYTIHVSQMFIVIFGIAIIVIIIRFILKMVK